MAKRASGEQEPPRKKPRRAEGAAPVAAAAAAAPAAAVVTAAAAVSVGSNWAALKKVIGAGRGPPKPKPAASPLVPSDGGADRRRVARRPPRSRTARSSRQPPRLPHTPFS